MRSLALAAMASCMLVVALPGAAKAWTGMHYCSGGAPCNPGSSGCQPIGWAPGSPNTVWRLSSTYTSADLTNSQVDAAVGAAFSEWGAPGCTEFNPLQSADTPGDPLDNANSNHIVGFLESSWPASMGGSSTLAVTMPGWYQAPYCEYIENADMVINGVHHNWVTGNPSNWNQADLESVIAHEAGHWIGFDHNTYAGSTLRASYSGGISERTLTCDDSEGVCAIYPSSGNACTADRYCDCGVGCNGGYCGGTPTGDDDDSTPTGDDDTAGDDDDAGDDISGPCSASSETFYETEPNDWVADEDVDWFQSSGGDTSVVGSLTCGNDGQSYTGDKDWFVVDFPCTDTARFTLDWNTNSDLDFYVYGTSGDPLEESATAETSGPVTADGLAGGRVYVLVMCWEGDSATYEFLFDWTPFQGSTLGDDDDTSTGDDDDTGSSGDDDTGSSGDDDTGSSGDDDDDDDAPSRRACGCYELDDTSFAGSGSTPLDAGLLLGGLFLVGLRRRRSDGAD
jgi:hypothetical protein